MGNRKKHVMQKKFRMIAFLVITSLLIVQCTFAQTVDDDKVSFTNLIKRMYNLNPFEGVKVIDDYDHQYFISVVSLEKSKYTNPSIMNRVAQVKAQSQANTFFNGSMVTSNLVIRTTENKPKDSASTFKIETLETIRENSIGFTLGLELLTNFENKDGIRTTFIYSREIIKNK